MVEEQKIKLYNCKITIKLNMDQMKIEIKMFLRNSTQIENKSKISGRKLKTLSMKFSKRKKNWMNRESLLNL